jgi:hypothetical protein
LQRFRKNILSFIKIEKMSASNHHDENVNNHGIEGASDKGYCMLYFAMFLFLLIGAIYMTIHGNINSVPELK